MTAAQPVVVASSDAGLVKLLQLSLHAEGMTVRAVSSGSEARRHVATYRPACVVVVDDLPDGDARHVLAGLDLDPATGSVVLVPRGRSTVPVLNAGADDCMTLPVHPDELVARMRAILRRRAEQRQAPVVRLGSVVIDLDRRIVERDGSQVRLSRTEWDVLACIAERMGERVLTDEILLSVWGEDARSEHARLRGWVSRIRRRLGSPPWSAGPIRKVAAGYLLDLDWRPPDDSVREVAAA